MNIFLEVLQDLRNRRQVLDNAIRSMERLEQIYPDWKAFETGPAAAPPEPAAAEPPAAPPAPIVVEWPETLVAPRVKATKQTERPDGVPPRRHGDGRLLRTTSGLWVLRFTDADRNVHELSSKTRDFAVAEAQLNQLIVERDKIRADRATEKLLAKQPPAPAAAVVMVAEPSRPATDPTNLIFPKSDKVKPKPKIATTADPKCGRSSCPHTLSQHTKQTLDGQVGCIACWCYGFVGEAKAVSR